MADNYHEHRVAVNFRFRLVQNEAMLQIAFEKYTLKKIQVYKQFLRLKKMKFL